MSLAQSKRKPGIGFKLLNGANSSQAELRHRLTQKQSPDLVFTLDVPFTPRNPRMVGFRMIVPMLDAIFAHIIVPDDRLARVKQVITMGKSTQRHGCFLAQKVKFGIVGHFANESAAGKEKSCREEARSQGAIERLPSRDSQRPHMRDTLGGESLKSHLQGRPLQNLVGPRREGRRIGTQD